MKSLGDLITTLGGIETDLNIEVGDSLQDGLDNIDTILVDHEQAITQKDKARLNLLVKRVRASLLQLIATTSELAYDSHEILEKYMGKE